MDADARSTVWQSFERIFRDNHVPLGGLVPLIMMIEVRAEDVVPQVRTDLGRAGVDVHNIERSWWPFGRRWKVTAKSRPVPMTRAAVDERLDTLDAILAKHDATVVSWIPQV